MMYIFKSSYDNYSDRMYEYSDMFELIGSWRDYDNHDEPYLVIEGPEGVEDGTLMEVMAICGWLDHKRMTVWEIVPMGRYYQVYLER